MAITGVSVRYHNYINYRGCMGAGKRARGRRSQRGTPWSGRYVGDNCTTKYRLLECTLAFQHLLTACPSSDTCAVYMEKVPVPILLIPGPLLAVYEHTRSHYVQCICGVCEHDMWMLCCTVCECNLCVVLLCAWGHVCACLN